MRTIAFDTFKYVERLEKAGFAREQASVFVDAQREAMSQAMDTTLASKLDIQSIKVDMQSLRSEITADMQSLKGELKLDIASLRGEMTSIKWMVGVLMALAFANFAKQYF